MKAEEKAKQLFNKYCYAIRIEETDSGYFTNVLYAKQCALIAVDVVLESSPSLPILGKGGTYGEDIELSLSYWKEVKQEIEKL